MLKYMKIMKLKIMEINWMMNELINYEKMNQVLNELIKKIMLYLDIMIVIMNIVKLMVLQMLDITWIIISIRANLIIKTIEMEILIQNDMTDIIIMNQKVFMQYKKKKIMMKIKINSKIMNVSKAKELVIEFAIIEIVKMKMYYREKVNEKDMMDDLQMFNFKTFLLFHHLLMWVWILLWFSTLHFLFLNLFFHFYQLFQFSNFCNLYFHILFFHLLYYSLYH